MPLFSRPRPWPRSQPILSSIFWPKPPNPPWFLTRPTPGTWLTGSFMARALRRDGGRARSLLPPAPAAVGAYRGSDASYSLAEESYNDPTATQPTRKAGGGAPSTRLQERRPPSAQRRSAALQCAARRATAHCLRRRDRYRHQLRLARIPANESANSDLENAASVKGRGPRDQGGLQLQYIVQRIKAAHEGPLWLVLSRLRRTDGSQGTNNHNASEGSGQVTGARVRTPAPVPANRWRHDRTALSRS